MGFISSFLYVQVFHQLIFRRVQKRFFPPQIGLGRVGPSVVVSPLAGAPPPPVCLLQLPGLTTFYTVGVLVKRATFTCKVTFLWNMASGRTPVRGSVHAHYTLKSVREACIQSASWKKKEILAKCIHGLSIYLSVTVFFFSTLSNRVLNLRRGKKKSIFTL